jgi:formate hydrogenlyase subunit 4
MHTPSWTLPLAACLLAPLLSGVINRIKALFAGRRGQPLLQGYYDLARLLRKATVYSQTTTLVFRLAPALILAAMLLAVCLIPWGNQRAPLSFTGDFILLAYLLGMVRFVTVLAALDTGSSFEGMGASREVQFAALAEPTFFLGMLLLAIQSGTAGLSDMALTINLTAWRSTPATLFLLVCAWLILLLAENARIPVDDPNTHLELTMIHEVMILDYSGPDLGMIQYAAALKLWLFSALITNLAMPLRPDNGWLQMGLFLGGTLLVAVVVGVIESVMARLRLSLVPKLLVSSGALVGTALIMRLVL